MPNLIKSATTVSNGAIKRNNFLIGVNTSVDYGQTSSTGFWSGIVPPAGGYTVYAQKESQGPSIRVASTDSELIEIARQYGGTDINTVNDALNFFNGQSQYMVTNIDYENIVTNGLIFLSDAGYIPSYPRFGTTWSDLSGNNNNGALTNGPTYSSDDGGSIVFDGINDYITILPNSVFNLTTAISFDFWFKSTRTVDSYISTKKEDSFYICVGPTGQIPNKMSFYLNGTSGGWLQSNTDVSTGNWTHISLTWDGSTSKIYVNGVLDISESRVGTLSTGNNVITLGTRLNASNNIVGTLLGNLASFSIYNRTLSASEALQNYNAQKSRFGL